MKRKVLIVLAAAAAMMLQVLPVSAEEAGVQAPSQEPFLTTYTVQQGDSLSAIADKMYGDRSAWKKLYKLNKDTIRDPHLIYAGQVLKLKAYRDIAFDHTWDYAGNAAITDGMARLYRSDVKLRKNKTICINAGHGTEGGADVKTLCHPDGSPKLVTGTTAAGATYATAISKGVMMATGEPEASATLRAAFFVKDELLKAGYDVLMIRESDDVQLDNIARTLIADHYADAHIALHYDSTTNDKGVFFCSVPDSESYRNMEPVSSWWQLHDMLGRCLIMGLEGEGLSKWKNGELEMDLTQTSYSTIPSVDLEIGDTVSDRSDAVLSSVARGIRAGLDLFFA